MNPHIIIIGGGQAGGWAAKTLRDEGYNGQLSIISDEDHDFYERPPLSKNVLSEQEPELPRLFSKEIIDGLNINWHRPLRVTSINPSSKSIQLSNNQQLDYTQLIIATGGRPRWPSEQWKNQPRIKSLRTWADAQELKKAFQTTKNIAIIGGGWIGLEIAATAKKLGKDITIFERQSRLCQRSVGEDVSNALYELHAQQGVSIYCDCGEINLSNETDIPVISTSKTNPKSFDLVIVGIGIDLNIELAQAAGLELNQGIVVDRQGKTSHPDIYAIGDVACHPTLGISPQSWAHAQNQSIATAKAILNPQAPTYDDMLWLWSDQYQTNIQILGIPPKEGIYVKRETLESQLYFTLDSQYRLSQLITFNDSRTIKLGKRWIASGKTLDPVQLADPDFSLMTLK